MPHLFFVPHFLVLHRFFVPHRQESLDALGSEKRQLVAALQELQQALSGAQAERLALDQSHREDIASLKLRVVEAGVHAESVKQAADAEKVRPFFSRLYVRVSVTLDRDMLQLFRRLMCMCV